MISLPVLTRKPRAPGLSIQALRWFYLPTDHPRGSGRVNVPRLLAWAGIALLLSLPLGARADVQEGKQRGNLPAKQVRNAPASAVPDSEEMDPGDQVEITLRAHGGGNRAITFDFATQPQHGQLTGFRLTSHNTAVVTYVHDARSGPGHDQFSYRVQATGTAMSAPVVVDIEIHEYLPRLAASPSELDFGAVDVGQEGRAQLTLRNDGGGVAVGRLEPPEPWVVDGSPEFRLPSGEKQTFRLVFRPTRGRSFSETFRVGDYANTNQHPATLHLLGTGLGADLPPDTRYAGINGAPPLPAEVPLTTVPGAPRGGGLVGEAVGPAGNAVAASGNGNNGRPGYLYGSRTETPGAAGNKGNGNGAGDGSVTAPGFEAPLAGVNEAGVKAVQVRSHGRTDLELAWQQPHPLPSKYRIEVRYLSLDQDDNLRIDWQPYSKVDYDIKNGMVVANLRGLPAGTSQTIQVVAVDSQGRLAAPSPALQVQMDPALYWWKLSIMQWLLLLLVVLVVLIVRRHWEDRQILAQIDIDRISRRRAEA